MWLQSRTVAWVYLVQWPTHTYTYRAIRRGRNRPPVTELSAGFLCPGDARVGRRKDRAIKHDGSKFLYMIGLVVNHDASDRASLGGKTSMHDLIQTI